MYYNICLLELQLNKVLTELENKYKLIVMRLHLLPASISESAPNNVRESSVITKNVNNMIVPATKDKNITDAGPYKLTVLRGRSEIKTRSRCCTAIILRSFSCLTYAPLYHLPKTDYTL